MLYCYDKHQDVTDSLMTILIQFGKYNLMELFTQKVPQYLPEKVKYIDFITESFSSIAETIIAKESIVASGVMDYWVDQCLRFADDDYKMDERIASLCFLTQVWSTRCELIEEVPQRSEEVLRLIKKGCRENSKMFKYTCSTFLFKLLEVFSVDRNRFAPIIYKTLTFLLIKNHHEIYTLEYFLKQFSRIFKQIKTIPVAILLETMIKQINLTGNVSYKFNTFDFQFFKGLTQHP